MKYCLYIKCVYTLTLCTNNQCYNQSFDDWQLYHYKSKYKPMLFWLIFFLNNLSTYAIIEFVFEIN